MPTVRQKATRDVVTVLVRGWKLIVGCPLVLGAGALLFSLLQTPVYQASVTLYVTSGANNQGTAMPYEYLMGAAGRVTSYTKLAYSDVVLQRAVKADGLNMTVDQARSEVRSKLVPESVMMTISAEDRDRERAKRLADAVAHAMIDTVSALEVPNGGGPPTTRLTVVSPASVDPEPVSPTTMMNVLIATLAGLLIGITTVLVRERLNNTVRDEQDIEKVVGIRPLESIPRDRDLAAARIVDFDPPPSLAAGAFRHLRTVVSVANANAAHAPAKILVTSPRAGEGKSTVALNLGAAFAESGRTVVVVDANLGNPVIATRTGNGEGPGLAGAIRDQVPWLQRTTIDELKVIGAGSDSERDLADLLASSGCERLFEQLAESFDYVIVDSPALTDGPEAAAIVRWVDGVLLVARRGQSKISEWYGSVVQLTDIDADLIGVVLNDVRPSSGGQRLLTRLAFWRQDPQEAAAIRRRALRNTPPSKRPNAPGSKAQDEEVVIENTYRD